MALPSFTNMDPSQDGVPEQPPGTPDPFGVPVQPGTPEAGQTGDARQVSAQPQVPTQVDLLQRQLTQSTNDLNRMKSSLQSSSAIMERKYQETISEMETRMRELETRGMSEEDKAAYELKYARTEVASLRQEAEQSKQEADTYRQMAHWAEAFTNGMGVSHDRLDMTNVQTLLESGWADVQRRLNGPPRPQAQFQLPQARPPQQPFQAQQAQLPQQPGAPVQPGLPQQQLPQQPIPQQGVVPQQPPQPQVPQQPPQAQQAPTAPPVMTSMGGSSPMLQLSISAMLAAARTQTGNPDLSEEQFFYLCESGRIDPTNYLRQAGLE